MFAGLFVAFGILLSTQSFASMDLAYFEAHVQFSNVVVKWGTDMELNNDHFQIQRSLDAENWETVAYTPGQGQSNTLHQYETVDQQPVPGTSYYRVMQMDYSGAPTYSFVVTVEYSSQIPDLDVYPIPGNDLVNITGNASSGSVKMMDMLGQVVREVDLESNQKIQWQIDDLPEGNYLIQLTNTAGVETLRFVID
jgi:hypothetical protein